MMPEAWYPFFDAAEQTMLGVAVRESIYAFPLIEATHLVALCVMGGALLVVDLRMLGVAITTSSGTGLDASDRPSSALLTTAKRQAPLRAPVLWSARRVSKRSKTRATT